MPRVRLGPIQSVVLMGGGVVLYQLAQAIQEMGLPVEVWMAPRHATETIPGGRSLELSLGDRKIPHEVLSKLEVDQTPLTRVTPGTLGLSLGAAWIFREDVIRLFQNHLLNCHGAALPSDRGGGGASWPILRGDRKGLSALHLVDLGVDTGPIVAARRYTYASTCRIPKDYYEEKARRDFPFLLSFIRQVRKGCSFHLLPQDHSRSTHWPRLETDLHGAIDWRWSVEEIERFICAFDDPYAGAFTQWSGQTVRLKGCIRTQSDPVFHSFQSGLIYRVDSDGVCVACRGGNLKIRSLVSENSGASLRVRVGDRLWTPDTVLEKARETRVTHLPSGERVYG